MPWCVAALIQYQFHVVCILVSSILPKLKVSPGMTVVTVHIAKIGLKDASEYIDPVITISCKGMFLNGLCKI